MIKLLKMVKKTIPEMILSISFGVIGNIFAIAFMILGGLILCNLCKFIPQNSNSILISNTSLLIILIIICALFRGLLRFLEQYLGHNVAFKILSTIRDKVFKTLQKLAPAKLSNKDSGEIISTIMGDIELIEVFFAHTIAPVVIGFLISLLVLIYAGTIWLGFIPILLIFQSIVGIIIPIWILKNKKTQGKIYRNECSKMETFLLDSTYGLKELIIFNQKEEILNKLGNHSNKLNDSFNKLEQNNGLISAISAATILTAISTITLLGSYLFNMQIIKNYELVIIVILTSSSFAPLLALSSLSNSLLQTFSSAKRIFDLIEEKPSIPNEQNEANTPQSKQSLKKFNNNTDIILDNITFSYPNSTTKYKTNVIENLSYTFPNNSITHIKAKSGTGKSTIFKLLLRYYDTNKGAILYNNQNIKNFKTQDIRQNIALLTQTTFIFNDTILNNIKIGNPQASINQIIEAAKKASINDFIQTLPNKYNTILNNNGSNLSAGEKQRIGLARIFLKNAPIVLLDEPTSNLDSINESIIYQSIRKHLNSHTVIINSHKESISKLSSQTLALG